MRHISREQSGGAKHSALSLKRCLIFLTAVTLIVCGVTFSKYTVSSSGSDGARAASFGELALYETDADGNRVTEQSYIITPGVNLRKDPAVDYGIKRSSETAVYVFVTVTAEGWSYDGSHGYRIDRAEEPEKLLEWSVNGDWELLEPETNGGENPAVFYRTVPAGGTLNGEEIIENNEITVSEKIYANEMERLNTAAGDIKLQAYAVQAGGFETAADAWKSVSAQ